MIDFPISPMSNLFQRDYNGPRSLFRPQTKYSNNMIHPSWMLGCYDIPALMRMSITQTVMDFLITVLSCGICHLKFFHLAPVLLKLNCILSCGKIHVKWKHQRTRTNICCTINGNAVCDYVLFKIMWALRFYVYVSCNALIAQIIMLLQLYLDMIIPECKKRNA